MCIYTYKISIFKKYLSNIYLHNNAIQITLQIYYHCTQFVIELTCKVFFITCHI